MLKNKIWIGLILAIILTIFSIPGSTAYYKYTQESGADFYVGAGDKSDAQEDTNQVRQILDDLGDLLGHSKRDNLYPEDGTTGGYLGRLNFGLDTSKPAVPVVNDMYLATDTTKVYKCFVAGNWVQVYPSTIENNVTKTGAFTAGKIAKINNASGIIEEGTNTDADVADAVTKKHTSGGETCTGDVSGTVGANTVDKIKGHAVDETDIGDNKLLVYKVTGDKYVYETYDLSLYYLKTEIDTLSKVETIYTKNIIDSDELAALKFTDLADTPANYTDQAGKYVKVNAGETALEFGTPTGGAGTYLELTDTPVAYDNGKYAKSTADGVVWDDPAGAGDMTKAVYDTDADNIVDKAETVDDGMGNSSTAADVKDAVTKKHSQNTDTDLDATFEATFAKKADKLDVFAATTEAELYTVLSDVDEFIEAGDPIERNYYSALGSNNTYSGNADVDTIVVGEAVTFGDLLYHKWSDHEYYKAQADVYATARCEVIALESKTDGQSCLVLRKGYIRDDTAFNFAAVAVFLNDDTAGTCSSTAPAESEDQIQIVGTAKSADILFFNPSVDVGEVK